MHIVLKHSVRQKNYIERYRKFIPPILMNVVADAKVNQYVLELPMFKLELINEIKPITPEWVEEKLGIQKVKEKSLEEILDELKTEFEIQVAGDTEADNPPTPPSPIPPVVVVKPKKSLNKENQKGKNIQLPMPMADTFGKEDGKEDGEGKKGNNRVPINEGDKKDAEAEGKGQNEIEKRWSEKISETLISAKMAGLLPAGWERLVNELLKPEINWRRLLLTTLTKGIGTEVRRTWSRPSRKFPFAYPGKDTLEPNRVLVLVDTSGSIGEKELRRFVSEVYGILNENAEVVVIPWDATAYEPIVLKSQRDVEKLKTGLKGGGGTCILPALRLVDEKFGDADMVVIFSDWEISDIDNSDVQRLLKKYSNRILAFTTYGQPPEHLRSFKVRIE
jgi:predicted metal-dependent peptidase